jgi:hypothetical protein
MSVEMTYHSGGTLAETIDFISTLVFPAMRPAICPNPAASN